MLTHESQSDALHKKASHDVENWIANGERPLAWSDADYPRQLREVHDFPPVIFVRGALLESDHGVCVVGSRNAGRSALTAMRQISRLIVDAGWSVVSGLARGIDTAAHSEALRLGGRTVAVLGAGIDRYYPPENQHLQHMLEESGMTLSQFWPGTSPTQYSFPMRNAVMSAYANATIIVSAEEASGTRHQAKRAAAHGRPLVVSKAVYENTTWGRKFVDNPSVLARVAYSPEEAVAHAKDMATFDASSLVALS